MAQLEAICKPTAIISSNTSGIPINEIAAKCSADFKSRFLGTHFFNPPRYLKLLEIIPTGDTSQAVIDFMVKFGTDVLGKGVVVCKDTPNFIANRFIAVVGSFVTEYALTNGYSIPEVDSLTGPIIGHPKTGTFRLTDLVGLDVMMHVNANLYPAIPHDPYREWLVAEKSVAFNEKMKANQWLGNKTGQGFYKKTMVNGNREFHVINPETMAYEPDPSPRFESVGKVRKITDLGKRLNALLEYDDRAANFTRDTLYFSLVYAAYVSPEIAYTIVDVDNANRWGFAHEAGPFEIWDMLGVAETVEKMVANGLEMPAWITEMLDSGHDSFYKDGSYYDWNDKKYVPMPVDPKKLTVANLKANGSEIERNGDASLHDMGDGVMLFEFHSKMNAIGADIVAMGYKALERLNTDFDAMVIGNNGQDFCIGANLAEVGIAAAQGLWDQVEAGVKRGQQLMMDLRHAPKPVVTAPHQRVLGGGVEMTMHGWSAVADHETYLGLVEVGVGIIPGWGGCKELLRRRINPVMREENADVLPALQQVFTQVATATVATSAWEARSLGYLRDTDQLVFNSDHRLYAAKQQALALVASGAQPPEYEKIYAAGRDALYALYLGLQGFEWGRYASAHDAKIGRKLAFVMCGGDLSAPAWVDPWYILDLEREALLSLAGEPLTQARVMHMLQTGKPLRN
jgi:3-hydroxyacyl-CoA dehydrogenase